MLAMLTGWQVLDPALAALVGANILWAGWRLVREFHERPDGRGGDGRGRPPYPRRSSPPTPKARIEAHDVKTRAAGRVTFIEFHLVVPGNMTVAASHEICDRIEMALTEAVPGAQVLIHVEPEAEAKQTGVPVV